MIEYALLIMLGFCIAGLIALLLAPTFWHRAVRLTTKRLEATMPMSLSEIEADKDLLRASYAIRIRRLEAGLNKAREKSANHLVDISKHQMQIAELNERISSLKSQLEERQNAANVFESTIRKRFPELENMVAAGEAALAERGAEIKDLYGRLQHREQALEIAQRSALLQQEEIRQLRATLERAGSDTTGRFKRRASQWTLEDYRSEYDRLNVELSKMREQLLLAQERETRQTTVLRSELQQLAERIMTAAAAGERQRQPDAAVTQSARPEQPVTGTWTQTSRKQSGRGSYTVTTQPWPGERTPAASAGSEAAQAPVANPARASRQPNIAAAPATASADAKPAAGQNSLRSLLDRDTLESGRALLDRAAAAASGQDKLKQSTASDTPASDARPATEVSGGSASKSVPDNATPESGAVSAGKTDPKLDQVFREIIESGTGSAAPAQQPAATEKSTDLKAEATQHTAKVKSESDGSSDAANERESKTKTLLDRLRNVQERQIG